MICAEIRISAQNEVKQRTVNAMQCRLTDDDYEALDFC